MADRLRLGIFISGRGSNMESILKSCSRAGFPAVVSCVISNNPNAQGLSIAESYGVDTFVINRKPLDLEKAHEILQEHKVDLVCLAGFMSIVKESFIRMWHHKIINIHPSLLPSFKGLNAQEQAFKAGVKIAGCTIHYVFPELDSGPIILQGAVPVLSNDTAATLSSRILTAEHICYPKAIELLALGKIQVEDGTVKCSTEEKLFFFLDV